MSNPPPIEPPLAQETTLNYATEYVDTRRPGVIIAMGVLSIVFSVAFALSAGFSLLMTIGLAASPGRQVYSSTTMSAPTPDGIGQAPRSLISLRIQQMTMLSSARKDVLDGFLAQKGTEVDPHARRLTDPNRAAKMITAAGALPEGETFIDFNRGRMTLTDTRARFEPTGTTHVIEVDFSAVDPAPGEQGFVPQGVLAQSAATSSGATTIPVVMPKMGATSIALQTINGIMAVALALLLLIAGIFTVQSKALGRRLHLVWAWLKLASAVFGAIATYTMYVEIMKLSAASGGANTVPANSIAIVMALMSIGVAVLYPIAVLIVMNLRSVKNYLASVA